MAQLGARFGGFVRENEPTVRREIREIRARSDHGGAAPSGRGVLFVELDDRGREITDVSVFHNEA